MTVFNGNLLTKQALRLKRKGPGVSHFWLLASGFWSAVRQAAGVQEPEALDLLELKYLFKPF